MPHGTKVDRCYQKLKKTRGEGHAAAICQSSTGESLRTGKPLKGRKSLVIPRIGCSKLFQDSCSCKKCGGMS